MDDNIDSLKQSLELFIEQKEVEKAVESAVAEVLEKLQSGQETHSVSITPDQIPSLKFPRYANLIRVYGAKASNKGRVEKHPNGFQSLKTIKGNGVVRTFEPGGMVSQLMDQSGQQWSFVPEDTWHQPMAGTQTWVGITFHSASAEDIIDEYKD